MFWLSSKSERVRGSIAKSGLEKGTTIVMPEWTTLSD